MAGAALILALLHTWPATVLAAAVLAHLGGYGGLYTATALVTLLAGVLVHRIRGVT